MDEWKRFGLCGCDGSGSRSFQVVQDAASSLNSHLSLGKCLAGEGVLVLVLVKVNSLGLEQEGSV